MHSNEVSFLISEHVPLFKHGLLEHGLRSVWHEEPVRNWLHSQTNFWREFNVHTPWLEQFAKHADKSPVYADSIEFSWPPVLFPENIDDGFIVEVAKLEEECSIESGDEKLVLVK